MGESPRDNTLNSGPFDWEGGSDDGTEDPSEYTILGRLWGSKNVNVKAAIETMCKLWTGKQTVVGNVIDVPSKTFMFRFSDVRDKLRVLEGQPWHFDRFVWCFNDPNPVGTLWDVPMHHVPLWARIYDLPLEGRTRRENCIRMGNQIGTFIGMDETGFPELERSMRMKILHDVRVPLKKNVDIRMKGGRVVSFMVRYEGLPLFCYGCGVLGHGEKDCEHGPYEAEALEFGTEIRASPWKPMKPMMKGDTDKARNLVKVFDEEKRKEEEDAIDKMVKRLQAIAVSGSKNVIADNKSTENEYTNDKEVGLFMQLNTTGGYSNKQSVEPLKLVAEDAPREAKANSRITKIATGGGTPKIKSLGSGIGRLEQLRVEIMKMKFCPTGV
ncbi:hypothetical protein vseg_010360 [Gypsophila vaccaria]